MSPMAEVGHLLVNTIFGLLVFTIMLRFLLQAVRADFYNPISQFTVKATNPLLLPIRKIVPGWGGLDIAALVLAVLVQAVALILLFSMQGNMPDALFIFAFAAYKVVDLLVNVIYFWGIFIMIIASWIAPGSYNPVLNLLHQIIEPIMAPIRKYMPDMGGIDLSPLIAILAIKVFDILVLGIARQLIAGLS